MFAFFPYMGIIVFLFFLEGLGLAAKWAWVHRLGIVLRRGSAELLVPLGHSEPLPSEPRGAIAVWLGERELGYWSGVVRFGMRGAHAMKATYGVGVLCTGTLVISADRQSVFWKERVRLSPILLVVGVGLAAGMVFSLEVPYSLVLFFPMLFFGSFYTLFLVISLGALQKVRQRFLAP